MKAFILGTVFGIAVSTVGFSGVVGGIAKLMDKGVDTVKTQSVELAK
jgi:hypothetical protein